MTRRTILKDIRGLAAVEFALVLPVLLALLLGVLEFGVYFTKSSVVSRAVSNISAAIQMSPTANNLQSDANSSGFGLVHFTGQNYFCALSYSTRELAGNYCTAGQWQTGTPAGHPAGTPYYVAIVASVRNEPISGLTAFLPDMVVRNIVTVGGSTSSQAKGLFQVGPNTSTSAISGSWVVPANVSSIKVTTVGGGAAGSKYPGYTAGDWTSYQAGGPSGTVYTMVISGLNEGNSFNYSVSGKTSTACATTGGSTSFGGRGSLWMGFSSGTLPYGTVSSEAFYGSNLGSFRTGNLNGGGHAWYIGGVGGHTPLGYGFGGTPSTHNVIYTNVPIVLDGRGAGSGGAGAIWYSQISGNTQSTTTPWSGAVCGAGAGGLLIVEW